MASSSTGDAIWPAEFLICTRRFGCLGAKTVNDLEQLVHVMSGRSKLCFRNYFLKSGLAHLSCMFPMDFGKNLKARQMEPGLENS